MQAAHDRIRGLAPILKRKTQWNSKSGIQYLKVSPYRKGSYVFGKRGKLNPRYVGPFKVIGNCCRGFALTSSNHPEELSIVVSKYIYMCPTEKKPVKIIDHEVKRLKRSWIPLVKVRWNSKRGPEFTWEREDQFKKKYPHLFTKTAPSSSAAS
ncbi:hypothetical protein Tco_0673686 [Tanacetum coccineum]